jgi:hypothetical protein
LLRFAIGDQLDRVAELEWICRKLSRRFGRLPPRTKFFTGASWSSRAKS